MAIQLYTDHNVPRAIVDGLRSRGVDIVTSYEDGTSEFDDSGLLDRATELGRALFTRDYDLLQEATKRQSSGVRFSGVVYAHQLRVSVGTCIRDLEIIAEGGEPGDIEASIVDLPPTSTSSIAVGAYLLYHDNCIISNSVGKASI